MNPVIRHAVEKLNSDIRNYLTPIMGYTDVMLYSASEPDRRRLNAILTCAEGILASLDAFVLTVENGTDR